MEKLSFDSKVTLRNGVKMPRFGYGSAEIAPTVGEQTKILRDAIEVGYRLIDTANIYHTERAVGQAVKESGIDREEFFITTKIWNNDARKGKKEVVKALAGSGKIDTDMGSNGRNILFRPSQSIGAYKCKKDTSSGYHAKLRFVSACTAG